MGSVFKVLEVARKHGCAVFVPSSIGAFGETTPKDHTPQDTLQRPSTMYGVTKVAGELLCDYYHRRFGVDTRGAAFPRPHLLPGAARRRHHRLRGRHFLAGPALQALHLLPAARDPARHDVHAGRARRGDPGDGGRRRAPAPPQRLQRDGDELHARRAGRGDPGAPPGFPDRLRDRSGAPGRSPIPGPTRSTTAPPARNGTGRRNTTSPPWSRTCCATCARGSSFSFGFKERIMPVDRLNGALDGAPGRSARAGHRQGQGIGDRPGRAGERRPRAALFPRGRRRAALRQDELEQLPRHVAAAGGDRRRRRGHPRVRRRAGRGAFHLRDLPAAHRARGAAGRLPRARVDDALQLGLRRHDRRAGAADHRKHHHHQRRAEPQLHHQRDAAGAAAREEGLPPPRPGRPRAGPAGRHAASARCW